MSDNNEIEIAKIEELFAQSASFHFGGPNFPLTSFEKPKGSLGIPKKFPEVGKWVKLI